MVSEQNELDANNRRSERRGWYANRDDRLSGWHTNGCRVYRGDISPPGCCKERGWQMSFWKDILPKILIIGFFFARKRSAKVRRELNKDVYKIINWGELLKEALKWIDGLGSDYVDFEAVKKEFGLSDEETEEFIKKMETSRMFTKIEFVRENKAVA